MKPPQKTLFTAFLFTLIVSVSLIPDSHAQVEAWTTTLDSSHQLSPVSGIELKNEQGGGLRFSN